MKPSPRVGAMPEWCSLIVGVLLTIGSSCAGAQTARTDAGFVEGERLGEVDRYYGVPYAQPPVGPLRWRAPHAAAPWAGTRPAKTPGKPCAQYGNFFASNDPQTFGKPYGDEDCLYLNVWIPVRPDGLRPVLIFIHGGSGIHGDSAFPLYDGRRLSEENQIVVITANYRLGVFGSLQLQALQHDDAAENSGSFVLLDLIRLLDWVQANARAFGGDPDNVTIAGHSAGAVKVLALMRSPLAMGKFQRAISFSGLPFSGSAHSGEKRSTTFLQALMLQDGSIDEADELPARLQQLGDDGLRRYLYRKSTEEILRASGAGLPPVLVADGTVLTELDEPDGLAMEIHNAVPVMVGFAQDELTTLTPFKRIGLSMPERWPLINGDAREQTLFDMLGFWGSLRFRLSTYLGDKAVRREARRYLTALSEQGADVYAYQFIWDDYPEPWRMEMGAFHGLDLPFVFGNFIDDRPVYMRFAWTEDNRAGREALHQRMTASLRNFVESGDPNAQLSAHNVPWPEWGRSKRWLIWDVGQ